MGVRLMSLMRGNLAEVQAAIMAMANQGVGHHSEDQVEGNTQRQAGGWGMLQGVYLIPRTTSGTALCF